MGTRYLMVLNDGETFTNIEGCYVVAVPDDLDIDEIEETLGEMAADDFVVSFDVYEGIPIAIRPRGNGRFDLI